MPRLNRYHPYNRQQAAPALPSPRYPPPPFRTHPRPMPSISEQAPMSTFQPIYPNYIHGVTLDGKNLITRSILQGPDGTFHIQMQPTLFPSQCVGQGQPSTGLGMGMKMAVDPTLVAGQANGISYELGKKGERSDSAYSGSDSEKSENRGNSNGDGEDNDCAVTDGEDDEDVDALGEDDDDMEYEAFMRQRTAILNLYQQRMNGVVNSGVVV